MLKIIFLTKEFYKAHSKCTEIEQKENRPYVRVQIEINGVLWAFPLRSNINHKYAVWTDKENGCGIDLSKAVVIEKPKKYISGTQPYIRPEEFKVLKQIEEYWISRKFQQYVKEYKKAKKCPKNPRNAQFLAYSTLQYFEKYI